MKMMTRQDSELTLFAENILKTGVKILMIQIVACIIINNPKWNYLSNVSVTTV
jgi:hypothetical protein